jgi:SAM-dependent methyltransferase
MTAQPQVDRTVVFDAVANWRADIIADFRLRSAERCAAASPSPGFPQMLDSMLGALPGSDGSPWLDVGGGLGGTASWIKRTRGQSTVVVGESGARLAAARRLFPSLPLAVGSTAQLPFADHVLGAAVVSGVLSLLEDPRPLLCELARVVHLSAGIAVTDLFASSSPSVRSDPNVFWSVEEFLSIAARAEFEVTHLAIADLSAGWWPSAARQVDDEICRRHHNEPEFSTWWSDQEHLRGVIDDGLVQPVGLVLRFAVEQEPRLEDPRWGTARL